MLETFHLTDVTPSWLGPQQLRPTELGLALAVTFGLFELTPIFFELTLVVTFGLFGLGLAKTLRLFGLALAVTFRLFELMSSTKFRKLVKPRRNFHSADLDVFVLPAEPSTFLRSHGLLGKLQFRTRPFLLRPEHQCRPFRHLIPSVDDVTMIHLLLEPSLPFLLFLLFLYSSQELPQPNRLICKCSTLQTLARRASALATAIAA